MLLERIGALACVVFPAMPSALLCAQDNCEVQVYGSDTVPRGSTMFETHTNFTLQGSNQIVDGVRPTNHALHETIEITYGWTDWFETGFYIFSTITPDYGWQWVGDHIRPRVRAPATWRWPIGVSLSAEIGYQRPVYATDRWTLEIRPIVDRQLGRLYISFNPSLERSLHGPSTSKSLEFSLNFKVGYDVTKKVNAGLEYYGALGPLGGFDPIRDQQHQIFPVIDLNLGPNWEFNFGVGVGITQSTDHLLIKLIIGRRFGRGGRQTLLDKAHERYNPLHMIE